MIPRRNSGGAAVREKRLHAIGRPWHVSVMLATVPLESPENIAPPALEIVPKPGRAANGRFTPELAREMGIKARAAWAKQKADRIARAQEPEPVRESPEPDYVEARKAVMRAHIQRLDKQLEKARDPQAIKWLADSLAKLQDTERILDGRPAPANFKVRAQKRDTFAPVAPVE